MSDTYGPQVETTEERKPPTLADIVREKTDDGRRIIDFFLDVMEARVEGAELCHRIDAAKQLVKYGSKDAARFIARYRGVPMRPRHPWTPQPGRPLLRRGCGPGPSPCAPGPFTEDLLTVLSAVDEDLMARLVRAQTADGGTVIEFLDDVMQDRNEGFKAPPQDRRRQGAHRTHRPRRGRTRTRGEPLFRSQLSLHPERERVGP